MENGSRLQRYSPSARLHKAVSHARSAPVFRIAVSLFLLSSAPFVVADDGVVLVQPPAESLHGWEVSVVNDILIDVWYGDQALSLVEDWKYGVYGVVAQDVDAAHYENPCRIEVHSLGDEVGREFTGTASIDAGILGEVLIWRTFNDGGQVGSIALTRPPANGDADDDDILEGFDTVPWDRTFKNAITVGSLGDGSTINTSSSRGPIDDGRLAPLLVASADSGSGAASAVATATTTTLARYRELHPERTLPRGSLVKAVMAATAEDLGNEGIDYTFGFGLADRPAALDLVDADAAAGGKLHLKELEIFSGESVEFTVRAVGDASLSAVLCWTDPQGTPVEVNPDIALTDNPRVALDATTPSLLNDLDLRIVDVATGEEFLPWQLDASDPSAGAIAADNTVDPIEQVLVSSPVVGRDYRVSITSKVNLIDAVGRPAPQELAIVITGNALLPSELFQVLLQEGDEAEVRLSVPSTVGNRYQVESSTDLTTWLPQGEPTWALADQWEATVSPSLASETLYYRVREFDGFPAP